MHMHLSVLDCTLAARCFSSLNLSAQQPAKGSLFKVLAMLLILIEGLLKLQTDRGD